MAWHRLHRLAWALLALVACLACPRRPWPAPSAPAQAWVDVLSVGHGDAILIGSALGKHLLIDGGEAQAGPAIVEHLRSRSACPLDLVLLTHPHSDHAGGLGRVLAECGARQFMDSGYPHESHVYARLLATLEKRGIRLLRAEAGRQIDLGGGAVLTLLGPPQPFLDNVPDGVNANSVVSRLSVGKASVLLVGDATATEEAWLLGRAAALRSTVLKVGHHGSRTSATAEFLAAVAPRLAVISSQPDAPRHPHPETLERLRAARVEVLETAREGTIHLELDPEGITWSSVNHVREVRIP
jgi:beta-lactamase superfamily II metal-dependent hydrolase